MAWDKNGFRKYKGPRGSKEQWSKAASGVASGRIEDADLTLLGLTALPDDPKKLHKAWRQAMWRSHPDKGGSVVVAQMINDSYERLKELYENCD